MVAISIIVFIISILIGLGIGYIYKKNILEALVKSTEEKIKKIKEEANEIAQQSKLNAKQIASKTKIEEQEKIRELINSQEEALHEYEISIEREAQRISLEKKELDEIQKEINLKQNELKEKYSQLQELRSKRKELYAKKPKILEERAGISKKELIITLKKEMIDRTRAQIAEFIKESEEISESEYTPIAKRIMGIAIGRIKPVPFVDRIHGPIKIDANRYELLMKITGQDLAGIKELIGRDFSISQEKDGSFMLRVDGVDAVGREIARRLLEKLPMSIQNFNQIKELWDKKVRDMDNELIGHGRKAFKFAKIQHSNAHQEILKLLGRLYYRTSYYQNQWLHSIEAAHLMGFMVYELGLDPQIGKRAALLHDIGKALTHEREGSHALIGAELAEKYGESPIVVNAIAAHHGDVAAESFYARLVMAADALSGARPGARREISDVYMERIKDLENLAMEFPGVMEVYAVQAGREIRVVVDERHISDEESYALASKIADKIAKDMVFPGEIKVTVIRTFYAEEIAK